MTHEYTGVFDYFLEEWSTTYFPEVEVGYNFWPGDPSVGEPDWFEIEVSLGDKEIWHLLTQKEQDEIEKVCQKHFTQMKDEV